MAYKIIKPGTPTNGQPEQQRPQYNPLVRGAANFLQSGVESAGNLADLVATVGTYIPRKILGNVPHITPEGQLTEVTPELPSIGGAIRSASEAVLPEGYLYPNESYVRRAGAAIPGAAAAIYRGTNPLAAAASVFGGAAGEKGAEALGFKSLGEEGGTLSGTAAQLGASILGSGLANKGTTLLSKGIQSLSESPKAISVSSSIFGPKATDKGLQYISNIVGSGTKDIAGTAKKISGELYQREKHLGEKIWGNGTKYRSQLESFREELRNRGIPSDMRKELLNAANSAERNITTAPANLINGSKLAQIHEDNNGLYNLVSKNKVAKELFNELQGITKETAKSIGKTNKEWLNSWNDADDIYSALKYSENLGELNKEKIAEIVKNPWAASILQGLGIGAGYSGWSNPIAAAGVGAATGLGSIAMRDVQTISKFLEKPATQRILKDVFKGVANREIPQFTRAISRLNRYADSNIKEKMSAQPESPRNKTFKIIKRAPKEE